MNARLHHLLEASARSHANRTAVVDPGAATLTYRELNERSSAVCQLLSRAGVRQGDRVGVCAHKSTGVVASIFGILKAGAAYIPVDPTAPMSRIAYIFGDCLVRAIVVERALLEGLRAGFPDIELPLLAEISPELVLAGGPGANAGEGPHPDLAYILYTSGSTGKPKGVMVSHSVSLSFVNWASDTFQPAESDVFSNHSPFHFDLSILDLYTSIKHGARVVLIGDELGKQPAALAELIASQEISIWYSTPAILRLLLEFGKLERFSYPKLRTVLFAGEVFPTKHLRELKRIWSTQRFFNLYGPTETNVCTFYEIPAHIPEDRTEPYPIGAACAHCRTRVSDPNGNEVPPGQEGELYIAGGSVMLGYWNLPEQNQKAFYRDSSGTTWYKTGDVVVEQDGIFLFRGRRDRMVKRRSYRVELGEIEAALYRHPLISEAAVIATPDEENGVLITAFYSCSGPQRPSLIELKSFCNANLPKYMIPDRFSLQPQLPKTSTDKIDYQSLRALV